MDGAHALRSNITSRYLVDARFTNWKGKSEQLQLVPIRTDITTVQQHPRFDV